MYCSKCGQENADTSTFCSVCGNRLAPPPLPDDGSRLLPDAGPLLFFPTSKTKLVVMSLCTLNFYALYWFYKNWKFLKDERGYIIKPFWRAFFTIFFCYSLFENVREHAGQLKVSSNYSPGWQAIGFIILCLTELLDSPLHLASFLAVYFLLPVQETINNLNAKVFTTVKINDQFRWWNIIAVIFGVIFWGLILIRITILVPE